MKYLFICCFYIFYCYCTEFDHLVSSSDVLWPYPNDVSFGDDSLVIYPDKFSVNIKSRNDIIENSIKEYLPLFFPFPFVKTNTVSELGGSNDLSVNYLSSLSIVVVSNETRMRTDIEEMYELQIKSAIEIDREVNPDSNEYNAFLFAETCFGAIKGLETFSQLIQPLEIKDSDKYTYNINSIPLSIHDSPRFYWRGLMIDTASHYASVHELKKIIDAMSWSKLNVFHWHITDSASFPFESQKRSKLVKGAFSNSKIYSFSDIQEIIEYANYHGIDVIPEINIPSHVKSWSAGYPQIVVECENSNNQLDIGNQLTYDIISDLYDELSSNFPSRYIHIGGNDIDIGCYANNHGDNAFWDDKDILVSTATDATNYFFEQIFEDVFHDLKHAIIWEDLLDITTIPQNVVIQAYKPNGFEQSIEAGFKTILSTNYDLSEMQHSGENWKEFYKENLNELSDTQNNNDLAIGGEALFWSDLTIEGYREAFIWPSAAVIGERLWQTEYNLDTASIRLNYWICRLRRRGHESAEIEPGYCSLPPEDYYYSVQIIKESDSEIHFGFNEHLLEYIPIGIESSTDEEIEDSIFKEIIRVIIILVIGFLLGILLKLFWNKSKTKTKQITLIIILFAFLISFIYYISISRIKT